MHPSPKSINDYQVRIDGIMKEYHDGSFIFTAKNRTFKPCFGSGFKPEQAEQEFLVTLEAMIDFYTYSYKKLERLAIFYKGDWSRKGGSWFTILGIHFYFRYGKGMRGGWYIPLTKLNITVNNLWKLKLK